MPPELIRYDDHWPAGLRDLVIRTHEEFGLRYDARLDSDLDDPESAYAARFLLIDREQVVGSAALRGDGTVKRMCLRPTYRGRGLGRRLLDAVIQAARQNGHARLRLDTASHQIAAQRLYEAAGFRRTKGSGRTHYYELDL